MTTFIYHEFVNTKKTMEDNQDTNVTVPPSRGAEGGLEYIDLKECILAENEGDAQEVRDLLKKKNVLLWNIMSSPGSGKTTFITDVIRRLGSKFRFGVIEADIESTVDAEKVHALGIPTIQLRTGGGCHLDASMTMEALAKMPLDDLDILIIENVGNLVCPAEFDVGANIATMLLSIPEGDDKCIKYPLMFTVTKAVFVTKMDVAPYFDFSIEALERNARRLNADLQIIPVSVKTGEGMEEAVRWLEQQFQPQIGV